MTDLHQTASDQTCRRIDLRIGWAPEGVLWLVGKPASCSRGRKSSIFEFDPETGNPPIQRFDVLHCLRSWQGFQRGMRRGGSAHNGVSPTAQLIQIDPILPRLLELEAAARRTARANQKEKRLEGKCFRQPESNPKRKMTDGPCEKAKKQDFHLKL